jgi:hypothetical protein
MGEEEYVDTILNIDVLLMQVQSDMEINNNTKALSRLKEARNMILEINQNGDSFNQFNMLK